MATHKHLDFLATKPRPHHHSGKITDTPVAPRDGAPKRHRERPTTDTMGALITGSYTFAKHDPRPKTPKRKSSYETRLGGNFAHSANTPRAKELVPRGLRTYESVGAFHSTAKTPHGASAALTPRRQLLPTPSEPVLTPRPAEQLTNRPTMAPLGVTASTLNNGENASPRGFGARRGNTVVPRPAHIDDPPAGVAASRRPEFVPGSKRQFHGFFDDVSYANRRHFDGAMESFSRSPIHSWNAMALRKVVLGSPNSTATTVASDRPTTAPNPVACRPYGSDRRAKAPAAPLTHERLEMFHTLSHTPSNFSLSGGKRQFTHVIGAH